LGFCRKRFHEHHSSTFGGPAKSTGLHSGKPSRILIFKGNFKKEPQAGKPGAAVHQRRRWRRHPSQ